MATSEDELRRRRAARLRSDRAMLEELADRYGAAWAAIRNDLDRTSRDAEAARARGERVGHAWLIRHGRLDQLEHATLAEIRLFLDYADVRITAEQQAALAAGHHDALAVLRETLGAVPPGAEAFRPVLPTEQLAEMVGRSSSGRPLGELLAGLAPDAAQTVRNELILGVALGRNPRETARHMRGALNGNLARAMTIARTETLGVYRAATLNAYRANGGVVEGWIWHAELGRRTCAVCWAMHGSFHTLDETLDSHPNCFPGGVQVFGPKPLGSTERWFRGELVQLRTRADRRVAVTPNHPILTTRGWVPAGLLNVGDNVVCGAPTERAMASVDPDDEQVPARIQDVAETLRSARGVAARTVPTAAEDFHGDGIDGEVCVVRTYGLLRDAFDALLAEPEPELLFGWRYSVLPLLARASSTDEALHRVALAATPGVRESSEAGALLWRSTASQEAVGIDLPSDLGAGRSEHAEDRVAAYAVPDRESLLRFATDVETDEIVHVGRLPWSGQVYNLETREGWYIANGIVAHNCRCAMLPATRSWADLGFDGPADTRAAVEPGEEIFARQPFGVQRLVLGPGKHAAYLAGNLELADLVRETFSPRWGRGLREAALREVLPAS